LKQKDYLSLDNTNCLKGVLAICVFICHFWASIATTGAVSCELLIIKTLGRVCTVLGYLSVSCFFFFSGYGLMFQYQKKGKDYLKGFLLKRIAPLYLICIIFIVFYWLANIILGEQVNHKIFLQSFFFGGTVISKGWYLQAILLWYILFFLSFRFAKNDNLKILLLFVSYIFYVTLCLILKLSSTWYECCLCLLLGVLFAKYKDKIDLFLSKKYLISLLGILLLFLASFVLGNFSVLGKELTVISKCISAAFFSVLAVLLLKIFPMSNIITRFLGKLYLEIYILHGFFLMLFSSKYIFIQNSLLYGIATLSGTLILSVIIHPGIQKILAFGKKRR